MKLIKNIYKDANEIIAPDEQLLEKILHDVDHPRRSPMVQRYCAAGTLVAGVAAVAVSTAVLPKVMNYTKTGINDGLTITDTNAKQKTDDAFALFRKDGYSADLQQEEIEATPLPKLGTAVFTAIPAQEPQSTAATGNTKTVPSASAVPGQPTASPGLHKGEASGNQTDAVEATSVPTVTKAPEEIPVSEEIESVNDERSTQAEITAGNNDTQKKDESFPEAAAFSAGGGSANSGASAENALMGGTPKLASGSSSSREYPDISGMHYESQAIGGNGTTYNYYAEGKSLVVTVSTIDTVINANTKVNQTDVELSESGGSFRAVFKYNSNVYTILGEGFSHEEFVGKIADIAK